ncbi:MULTISPECIES: redoxin domain-containing protein [unclassified Thiocapsa]|uniref:redoxin domain-containing protein n=1 Tax=unclassified Thiocapsa TaxID=2641286 RepID=UPI0035B34F90
MKQTLQKTLVLGAVALAATLGFGVAVAAPKVGAPAPDFSVVDSAGETWGLGGLAGKKVVLEWTNHDCPYVVKHYASGNMQALQKEATDAGYVWLSVISSASGKQGHVSAAKADDLTDDRGAAPTAVLLDTSGAMGRAYDAKTTPHMYVIDPEGILVFMGGIDDKPTTDQADIEGARNYVRLAMADLAAGNPVATPVTRPYGCSVKY